MLALHAAAQGIGSIRILIVVFAILTVIFWRIALQIMIIIATTLLLTGAITLLEGGLHIFR